jgi:DNA polymerase
VTLLTLDFETYFASDYTLSGHKALPMSEYVRDERFHPFGAGIKIDDQATAWYRDCTLHKFFDGLDWNEVDLVGHNLDFDGLILSHYFGKVPRRYICTLSMARPLFMPNSRVDLDTVAQNFGMPPKEVDILNMKNVRYPDTAQWRMLEARAKGDVDRTYAIYKRMAENFPQAELDLIDFSVRAFADPKIIIDLGAVETIQEEDEEARKALIEAVGLDEKTLRSNDKFATELRRVDIIPPVKVSPTTGKKVYAFAKTDLNFQAFLNDEKMAPYYEARVAAKTTQTASKTKRLLKLGENGQAAPVALKYCGAHTFRWAGGDKINFQNFKKDNPLRRALTAPPGFLFSVVDLSQIEARINAWLAGQDDLLEQFRQGQDPYLAFARTVWPNLAWTNDDEKDKELFPNERFIGKVCILALGYQMGAKRFQHTLALAKTFWTIGQCAELVQLYRTLNSAIAGQWEVMQALIPTMCEGEDDVFEYGPLEFSEGGVLMPNGLTMRYPKLISDERQDYTYETINAKTGRLTRSKLYGGKLTENIVQLLARIIIGDHINAVTQKYRVVLTVHDEIVTLIPEKNADTHHQWVVDQCLEARDWYKEIPLGVDQGYGRVYSK